MTIMRKGGRSDALQVTFILTEEEEEGAEDEDVEGDPFNIEMTYRTLIGWGSAMHFVFNPRDVYETVM